MKSRGRRGQTTLELTAIFSAVAFCIALCIAVTKACLPRTYATVQSDAYYVARDVTWTVETMTAQKARERIRSKNRRLKAKLAPRKLKPPRNPLAEYNALLRQ